MNVAYRDLQSKTANLESDHRDNTALPDSYQWMVIYSGAPRAREARAERSTMGKKIW